jgi:hypothetical protein
MLKDDMYNEAGVAKIAEYTDRNEQMENNRLSKRDLGKDNVLGDLKEVAWISSVTWKRY